MQNQFRFVGILKINTNIVEMIFKLKNSLNQINQFKLEQKLK